MEKKPDILKFNEAFEFLNKKLFAGSLTLPVITLQRRRNARAYFCPDRFVSKETGLKNHELAMNPDDFERDDKKVLSTLLHEMCHQWQTVFGKPSRGGYHNREWADKMQEVGLQAISKDGGETGQKVSHEILEGDVFDILADEYIEAGFKIDWASFMVEVEKKPKSKVKYTCQACKINAWAKPETRLICGECENPLEAEPEESLKNLLTGDI